MPGPQPVELTKVTSASAAREAPLLRTSGGEVQDRVFRSAMTACAAWPSSAFLLSSFTNSISRSSLSWHAFGFKFFTASEWDPVSKRFGALPFIYGTLVSSLVALIIAVPLAVGVAVFTTEMCPRVLRGPLSFFVELLAAIPSVIYGLWAIFVLVPLLSGYVQPFLAKLLWAGPGCLTDLNMESACWRQGIILAIMIIPIISSITREVLMVVPQTSARRRAGVGCDALGDDPGWRAAQCARRNCRRRSFSGWDAPWEKPWRSPW
jgi:phosphate transport system permease protein